MRNLSIVTPVREGRHPALASSAQRGINRISAAAAICAIAVAISGCGSEPDGLFYSSGPFVASDGHEIVAAVRIRGRGVLYAFPRSGGKGRALVTDGDAWSPSGEPQGRRVVYATRERESRGRVRMAGPRSPPRSLTEPAAFDGFPQWSRDGQRIYFARASKINHPPPVVGLTHSDWDVYELTLDSGSVRTVTREHFLNVGGLAACGDMLVASGNRRSDPNGVDYLFSIDVTAGEVKRLGTLRGSHPAFFPSCQEIVYIARKLDAPPGLYVYELFVTNLSDGTARQLTSVGSYLGPGSVAPDGKSVVFLSDPERDGSFELWEVGVRGDSPHRIDVAF